jgi:3',5'-cyclic AMP phosphodiesterase CpdA
MLIAHISDFHVFSRRPETKMVRLDAAAVARRVAEDIARFTPALDAVMFTGDLTDGGSAEDYALLADILAPVRVPVFMVPGNHDKRAALRTAFAGRLPFEDGRFLNYEARLGDLRILALDTLIEGRVEGALERESLDWLAGKLAQARAEPSLILMHHPPFPSGIESLDRMALVGGRAEMAEMVRSCRGRPPVILAGHIHRPYKAIWNGAYCAVGGSPAFQVALDLAPKEHEPGTVTEPYAYFVYRLEAQGGLAVHTRFVAI